jgi:histone H3/H4
MLAALNTLIQLVLYGCACAGVVLLFDRLWLDVYQWIRRTYYGISHRQMLRVNEGFRTRKTTGMSWHAQFQEHLDILLKATLKNPGRESVARFLIFSVVGAVCAFALAFAVTHNVVFAGAVCLLVLLIPYCFLQIRRYHISIRNSYDIGVLINVIVPEYRKHHGSIMHTLKATVEELPAGPIRRAVARLTDRLTDHITAEEARRALDRFVKELGTSWAAQIANDIEHAVVDGVDVEYSLALLHKEFTEIEEARKAQNIARLDNLLLACVPFFMWPGMMLLLYGSLSRNIFVYQFDNPVGFKWFILTLVCTFGSFLIGVIFYRPKQDV